MDLGSGMPAIDVAVGLMFLFFLLSIICSQVNELVATLFNFRAGELKRGLEKLLGSDLKKKVLEDPFVTATKKSALRDPTYIRSRTFVRAMMNELGAEGRAPADVEATIEELPEPARGTLLRLHKEVSGKLDEFKSSLEDWYDDAMTHVSGWYRRRVQRWLLVYATVLTIGLNVDTGLVARTLWEDEALRASVATAAAAVEADANEVQTEADVEERLDALKAQLDGVSELGLPVGWVDDPKDPRAWPGWDLGADLLWRILGWAMTVAALSLGAPFWFDLLGKVARVRQTGKGAANTPERGRATG